MMKSAWFWAPSALALCAGGGALAQSVSSFPTTGSVPSGYDVVIAKPGVVGSAELAPASAIGAAGVPAATNSSAGIVQPDNASLTISSGLLQIKSVPCSDLPSLTGDLATSSCAATLAASGATAQTTIAGAVNAKGLNTSTFASPTSAPLVGTTSGGAPQAITLSSDLVESTLQLALATQGGVTAGSYGGAGTVAGFTLNSKGIVIGETNYPITPGAIGAAALASGGNAFLGAQTVNLNLDGVAAPSGNAVNLNLADGSTGAIGITTYGTAGSINFNRQDGTASSPTAVLANEISGSLMFQFSDGTAFAGCGLSGVSLDAFNTSDHAAGLRLFCPGRGETTTRSAGVWDQDGLGLGPNTFSGATPPRAVLDVESSATTVTTSDTATLGSSSATGTIVVGTLPPTWPTSGTMQVDGEWMAYTEVSSNSINITTRGWWGSTQAAHSCASSCTLDFALKMIGRGPLFVPDLSVMSNGGVGIGMVAPVPSAPAGSVAMATESLPGAAPIALTSSGDTIPSGTSLRRLKPTAAVTATETLPTAYSDGQVLYVDNISAFAITETFSPSANGWTNGTALAANSSVRLRWDAYTLQWDRE